jgi:hypothetical protein
MFDVVITKRSTYRVDAADAGAATMRLETILAAHPDATPDVEEWTGVEVYATDDANHDDCLYESGW